MWFETNIALARRRLFPNWLGFRRSSGDLLADSQTATGPAARLSVLDALPERTDAKSDGSNGKHLDPYAYKEPAWLTGWTDGRVGQPSQTHVDLVKAAARVEHLRALETLSVAAAAQAAELRLSERLAKEAEVKLTTAEACYTEVAAKRDNDRASFSLFLALLYVVTGFFLFLGDLPLSLLVAVGLDLVPNVPGLSIHNLGHVIANLHRFWEAVAVAIGIAALGIVFKMAADFFIETSVSPSRARRWAARIAFTAVTVLIVTTFVAVGVIRGVAHAVIKGTVPPAGSTDFVGSWTRALANEWSPLLGVVVFTLLALSFAVAGAVVFSAGAHRFLNVLRWREVRSGWAKSADAAAVAFERLENARSAVAASDVTMKSRIAAVEATEILQTHLYLHGYGRGAAVPETKQLSTSLYDRSKQYLDHLIAAAVQRQNGTRSQWMNDFDTSE